MKQRAALTPSFNVRDPPFSEKTLSTNEVIVFSQSDSNLADKDFTQGLSGRM
jgi:hypothetical protein